MSLELNKQIVRRFIDELWNGRQLQVADELFSADCVTHQLQSGQASTTAPRSPQHMKEHVEGWLAAFPDLHITAEDMLAEGNMVFTSTLLQGTHLGSWSGVAPTAKQVSIRFMVVHRIQDGKICEDWVLVESLGFLQQLGLAPPTAEMLENARQKQAS
jgi:steroid delta-isomerase-like uncharacterized protein